jgi:poly(3-hydroxybutyrate) depolymerase
MIKKMFVALILVIGFVTSPAAADNVTFKGATKTVDGDLLMLTGKLTKPQGQGRFPAIVQLHGCNGIKRWNDIKSENFLDI